jgi:hypothetical protein
LAEIPTSSPETRPKTAEQVIEQLCANLKKQSSFTVTMDVTYKFIFALTHPESKIMGKFEKSSYELSAPMVARN